MIHAGKTNIEPLFVNEVRVQRNYLANFCDVLTIDVSVMEGEYYHDIAPNKEALEITLRKIPLQPGEIANVDTSLPIKEFRYKATLFDGRSPLLEGNNPLAASKEKSNRGSFTTVSFQLMNPVIEFLRTKSVGSVFRDTTAIDLIRNLLTKYSKSASLDLGSTIKGVTVAAKANTVVRDHIEVPHLTPLFEMPRVVEEVGGGVYATGFEFYMQGLYWYLWSPYDLKAFDNSPRSLTIINVPNNRFPAPECSFRITPTQVIIIVTGEVKHTDFSEQQQLNQGNGVSFVDADTVMDFGKVDGNKLTIDRAVNVNEVVAAKRTNGLDVVKRSSAKITSNYMKEYSKLAARNGGFVQMAWENGDPDLLYPGMAVKFMYLKEDTVIESYGTLCGTDTFSLSNSNHIGKKKFNNQTALTIFIDRKLQ